MNAYLIYGKSNVINNECINRIVKNGLNIVNYDLNDCDLENIIEEAATFSLFDNQKYIIVKNSNIFNTGKTEEKKINKLIKYLDNPNEASTLIFVTNKPLDERKKIVKYFRANCQVIQNKDLQENDLLKKVQNEFIDAGYKISNFGLQYIIKSCLNNYDIISQEIKKIILYKMDDKEITDDDILNLVAINYDDNIFNFTNAVIKKNIKDSFSIFEDLKKLKIEPIILLVVLEKQYRLMYQTKVLNSYGKTNNEIGNILNENPNVIWHALQNGFNYSCDELLDKIDSLANLDYDIKSGKIDKFIGFYLFLLNV